MSSRWSHLYTLILILTLLTFTHASYGIENAHCLHVLKEIEDLRTSLRPPKSRSLDIFTRNEFVQIGDGTEAGLRGIRATEITSTALDLPPHPHGSLLGLYERVILPDFHAVTLVQGSPEASTLLVSGKSVLVPHTQLFPFITGSQAVVRQTLKKLLDLPLPFKEEEVVRFRSPEGPLMIGIVKNITEDTLTLVLPNNTSAAIPATQVFKMFASGNGDLVVLPPEMIPTTLSFTDVVIKPNFEPIKTQELVWSEMTFFPTRGQAAEALLDGAAKFTSLTHFLQQKPETQLEWLLIYYRLFMQPHPLAQDVSLYGVRHMEMFAQMGISHAAQDLAVLGTLLLETGLTVTAILLPTSGKSAKLWFEVTFPKAPYRFDPQTFIVDPDPLHRISLTSPYVLPYEDTRRQAQQDTHSDAAWIYFNPERLSFPL